MNIRKTIITATVAMTMVALIAPAVAGADTLSDLQAQINALLAQLAALQGTSSHAGVPAACSGVTFTRNLTVGSTGADVKCLQAILNTSASTQVATTGAGSPGMESMTFGPKTLVAVKKFQAANGFTPANQVGPMTRAKLNAWLTAGGSTSTTPPVTTPTGPVGVMLSPTTPAAGSIVNGQAQADLAHFTFTGSGTVTSVSLTRMGISDQNTLTNVYLYDGNVRLTDGYSFNASSMIVMNNLNIPVNGSHEISVRGDVAAAAANTASTLAAALTGYTANGTANTVNVMGNTMFVVVGNLATASVGVNTVTGTPSVNAGTSQYSFWTAPVTITVRSVQFKGADFKMIGSAPSDALANIKMFVDGVDTGKMGTVMAINGSNYIVFDLTGSPITLPTGSHTIDLRADVQKGTNRNVQISVQQAADLVLFDTQVGVNIAVGGTIPNNGATVSILTGSVTVQIDPTFNAMTNVTGGATNTTIAKFIVHAYGEDVKVNTLQVNPYIASASASGSQDCATDSTGARTAGTCGLQNVTLYVNGVQVGSQKTFTQTASTAENSTTAANELSIYSLGSQMIFPAGQDSSFEVRADVMNVNSIAYVNGTVYVTLPYHATATTVNYLNAQGQSSGNTVSVPPAAITTTGLSVSTTNLVVSKNTAYLNQSISPNTTGVKIGSYTIQNQSQSESVRLTSLNVVTTNSGATGVNDLAALRTSDTTGSGSTPIQPTGNDNFSVSDVLAPGASMTIDVFANTGADTTGTVQTKLTVASIGVTSNIASAGSQITGQSLTLGNGSVTNPPTLVVASSTPAQYIASAGGSTNASVAAFNFVSTSGASTITELKFTVSGADAIGGASQTVTNVCVADPNNSSNTKCAAPTGTSSSIADITNLNLAVPNGGSGLSPQVWVSYSSVGTGGITPATNSAVQLTFVKYTSGGTTSSFSPTVSGNTMTMVGSRPTLAVASGGNTGMILTASNKVGQVTITADAKGAIKVRQVNFALGYSGFTSNAGAGPSSITGFLALGGQNIAIAGSSCTASGITNMVCGFHSADGVAYTYANDFIIGAGQSQQFDLYVTMTSAANSGTNKAQVSSSIANSTSTSATAGTSAAFMWDDTSDNGGATALGLTGSSIYAFPTNAYSVSQ